MLYTSNVNNVHTLGSYNLIEMIGKGAFGSVYLAKKGENKYALKHIPFQNLDFKHNQYLPVEGDRGTNASQPHQQM